MLFFEVQGGNEGGAPESFVCEGHPIPHCRVSNHLTDSRGSDPTEVQERTFLEADKWPFDRCPPEQLVPIALLQTMQQLRCVT